MKKLMLALAVVIAAVAVEAASIDWKLTASPAVRIRGSEGGIFAGEAYLVLADYTSGIESAIKAGTFDGLSTQGVVGTHASISASTGAITGNTATSALMAEGASYSFQVLLVEKGTDGKVTDYFLTTAQTATTSTAQTPGSAAFGPTAFSGSANGWQDVPTSDIPEPTSGLLLLLGVAGLALKRKRA